MTTILGPVEVANTIKAKNNLTFPVVEDTDIWGGFQVVATTTERDSIPSGKLKVGMRVVVQADGFVYKLTSVSPMTWAIDTGGGGATDGDKGDITVSAGGTVWTIDAAVVTNAKLANVATATFKGRTTAGTGSPEDLTGTQATALLDAFSSTLKGLVPASGGGSTNFLRADGTWTAVTASSISGTLGAGNGGTGQSSYTVGDLLYASDTTTLSRLAGVATGNALISGGVGVAPSWGKIGLTTHVSGTLPVANGGTGVSTAFTSGSIVFAGASGVYSQDNANLFWDDVNNRLGIRTATPAAVLDILAGTTSAAAPAMKVTGTSSGGGFVENTSITITSGATGNQDAAFAASVLGASSVTYATLGISGYNGTTQTLNSYFTNAGGPIAVRGFTAGTNGSGIQTGSAVHGNVGVLGYAKGSVVNVGTAGTAPDSANNGTNVGVFGIAANAGTGTAAAIGGLFAVAAGPGSTDPSYGDTAALIADNHDTSEKIFLARDGGIAAFTIANNGYVTAKNTLDSLTAFQVQNSAGSAIFDVDTTNGRVGIGTATPAQKLEVVGNIRAASSTNTEINSFTTDSASYGQIGGFAPGNIYWVMRANGATVAGTFLGTPDGSWNTWQAGAGGNGLKVGVNASGQKLLLGSFEPGAGTSAVRLTLNDDEATFNEPAHDFDFRVKSQTNANMLFVDASANAVGIGTATPASALSVGATSQFQVNSTGNLTKVNNITYSFPSSQATVAGQMLTNDSAGNLTWTTPPNVASTGFADGSVTSPSIFFTSDTDTGIYRPTANQLAVATAGVQRLLIKDTEAVFNDGALAYNFRVAGDADINALFLQASTDRVGIGTATPTAKLDVQAGTPSGSAYALNVTGTLNTDVGTRGGAEFDITANGGSGVRFGAEYYLHGTFSANSPTIAFVADNRVPGTGTNLFSNIRQFNAGATASAGNVLGGVTNVGIAGYGVDGSTLSVGVLGYSLTGGFSAGPNRIGVVGMADTTAAVTNIVGGYFGLAAFNSANPTFTSSALIADNGSQAVPIFLARDNGTIVFTIADGGAVTATSTITASNLSGTNTGDQTITLTSDVTGSGTGSFATTIAAGVVTNSKLANVATATFKGRATAGTGSPEDLTGTQATALLNVFSSTLKGLAPSSGGGTANFLRADGTWAAPVTVGSSVTSATAGSVFFAGTSGVLAQNNANLFWDDVNTRLGLGTASPQADLHINKGTGAGGTIYLSGADVAHGMTSLVPTSVFGKIAPITATQGGLDIQGFNDSQAGAEGTLRIWGTIGDSNNANPVLVFKASATNGTGGRTDLASSRRHSQWQMDTTATALMTLMANGGLGIGIDPPDAALDVSTSEAGARLVTLNSNGRLGRFSGQLNSNSSGTHARISILEVSSSTVSVTGAAVTEAAGFYVEAPTIAGAGTPANTYALHVGTGNSIFDGNVGIGGNAASKFSVGATSQFQVNSTGNLTKVNNVTYSFPSSQATVAGQVLSNDTAGNLTWVVPQALKTPISTKTANYTITTADGTIIVNAASGPVTITLPSAASATEYHFTVKKVDTSSNAVTIAGTIDGTTNYVLYSQYEAVRVQSDGSVYWII